jgi:hypothetical protein
MLIDEFQRIKTSHRDALKKTAARVVLGPSVIRVFAPRTRDALLPVLAKIEIEAIRQIKTQEAFSAWFDENVKRVARIVSRTNRGNTRIAPGTKWGHSTKIVALFIRELVLRSRYFNDAEVERISPFLYVPIDGIVMKRLRKLNISLPFSKIREINTRRKFYEVQETLGRAAAECGAPMVWFDDNWGDRQ